MYERQYEQRRELGVNEKTWPHRILGGRQIVSVDQRGDTGVEIKVQRIRDSVAPGDGFVDLADDDEETLQADLVIAATGYQRNAHVDMLRGAWDLLPKARPGVTEFKKGITGWNVETEEGERKMAVGRDYRVKFAPGAVADEAGVWLQGCCEGTHGVSFCPHSHFLSTENELLTTPVLRVAERYPAVRAGHPIRRDCRVHLWRPGEELSGKKKLGVHGKLRCR